MPIRYVGFPTKQNEKCFWGTRASTFICVRGFSTFVPESEALEDPVEKNQAGVETCIAAQVSCNTCSSFNLVVLRWLMCADSRKIVANRKSPVRSIQFIYFLWFRIKRPNRKSLGTCRVRSLHASQNYWLLFYLVLRCCSGFPGKEMVDVSAVRNTGKSTAVTQKVTALLPFYHAPRKEQRPASGKFLRSAASLVFAKPRIRS